MKPGAKETKSKGAKDLQATLSLDSMSLDEAVDGLHLLDEIEAGAEAKQTYLEAARQRWPKASVFQSSR